MFCYTESKEDYIMRKLTFIFMLLFMISFGTVQAGDGATAVVKEGVKGAFSELERQVIKKYFHDNEYISVHDDSDESYSNKHKGKKDKSKEKGLPPGIAKNLARGKPLPPGIAKKQLPGALNFSLPQVENGYERTIVGNDVLLVEVDTGKIADIIVDAVLGE